MIYWKECRCFANTNTAFFLSPPPNNRFSRALSLRPLAFLSAGVLQVLWSRDQQRVSNANQRICSVHARSGEQPLQLPGQRPGLHALHTCTVFARGLHTRHGLHNTCTAFAWLEWCLHDFCTASAHFFAHCIQFAQSSPLVWQFVTTRSPHLAGAGGRGRAG